MRCWGGVGPSVEGVVAEDGCDGPSVAVLDPIGGRHREAAVVGAGDDRVSHRRGETVGEVDLSGGGLAVEAVGAGTGVEFGDEVAGWGQHDRVQACGAVVLPGVEDLVGDGG